MTDTNLSALTHLGELECFLLIYLNNTKSGEFLAIKKRVIRKLITPSPPRNYVVLRTPIWRTVKIMTAQILPAFTQMGEGIIFFYDNAEKRFPNL